MKTITCLNGRKKRLSRDYTHFLKSVHSALLERPDYVGVAPCGSQFKGCTIESSDYDVVLIAGDSKVTTENELGELVKQIGETYGKKADLVHTWTTEHFEINFFEKGSRTMYGHALWPLAYPFIGRTDVLKKFNVLARIRHLSAKRTDSHFAQGNLHEAVHSLIYWELGVHVSFVGSTIIRSSISRHNETAEKILSRGYSRRELQDIAVTRTHMWLGRMEKLVSN